MAVKRRCACGGTRRRRLVQRRSELGRAARGAEACAHEAAPTWSGEHERGSRETRWQWQTAAAACDARRGSDIEGEGACEEGKRAKRWGAHQELDALLREAGEGPERGLGCRRWLPELGFDYLRSCFGL